MIQRCFLFLFFITFFPSLLHAQRLVSVACAGDKHLCDSTLHAIYGEELFPYFQFDSSTRAMTVKKDWLDWNDTLKGDPIKFCRFIYSFQFPGALATPFFGVPVIGQNEIYIHDYQKNFPRCETLIDSARLDSITNKFLNKPLRECHVSIYTERNVGTDEKSIALDNTHVYLMVTFDDVNVKDDGKNKTTTTKSEVLVVDACTGFVPDKPDHVKTEWNAPSDTRK